MCLAIPGKVLEVHGKKATVDFTGIKKEVNVDLIKVKKDDYVLVYSNHIIETISKKQAMEILEYLKK